MNTFLALLAGCFFIIVWFLSKRFPNPSPSLGFSDLKNLSSVNRSFRLSISGAPQALKWAALFLFLCAFVDPHYFSLKDVTQDKETSSPTEGIAIYIIVDQSGSMAEEISAIGKNRRKEELRKIDLLKQVTKRFIENRPNDLIGLISFARRSIIQSPLTLDHEAILEELKKLVPLTDQAEAGTAIGYAVYKTVNLIKETKHFAEELVEKGQPAYSIKNSIIVLVTDGFQNVNPEDVNHPFRAMDLGEAAKFAKQNKVKLYAINVDPSLSKEEFGPQRRLMRRVAEQTGGKFYSVDSSNSLEAIYQEISEIEKSVIPKIDTLVKAKHPEFYLRVSLYPPLIALSMFLLLLSLLLETSFLRRAP